MRAGPSNSGFPQTYFTLVLDAILSPMLGDAASSSSISKEALSALYEESSDDEMARVVMRRRLVRGRALKAALCVCAIGCAVALVALVASRGRSGASSDSKRTEMHRRVCLAPAR